jgi:predicted RNA binding protein YcfA (HicA-like mRNA interferase family)
MLRALARLGVEEVVNAKGARRGKGSHAAVRAPNGRRSIVQHQDLPPHFVATILKQLDIDQKDFLAVLR